MAVEFTTKASGQPMTAGIDNNAVSTMSAARPRKSPKRAFSSELMGVEDDLMRALGTRVRITRRRGGNGSILIDYHSEEELDRLVNVLRSLAVDAR